jgi:hypothetical protein
MQIGCQIIFKDYGRKKLQIHIVNHITGFFLFFCLSPSHSQFPRVPQFPLRMSVNGFVYFLQVCVGGEVVGWKVGCFPGQTVDVFVQVVLILHFFSSKG